MNGTAALSGACSTGANIIDLVGYGTANCFRGSGDAPAPSNTTAEIRNGYANNNAVDLSIGTPNPHNSSYGSIPNSLSAVGLATPSTVTSGGQGQFTVTVVPAVIPASMMIAVSADLSAISGSSTQSFYDDGTHGDTTAGDNVFTFAITATVNKSGSASLPVTVVDAESGHASASIALIISVPVVDLPIHTIQGSKSLTATSISPYAEQTVITEGIVTGVGTAGYFIQARDVDADSDPSTPEGIYVYAGTGKVPAAAVIGNFVQVTGLIETYPSASSSHTPATELASTQGVIGYQYDGGAVIAVPVNNGNAQFMIARPQVGSHSVSITYAQQSNYAAASAPRQTFTVALAPVWVMLTPSSWYAKAGTTLTFQGIVNSYSAGNPNATGALSFSDGSVSLATVPVDGGGKASFSTSSLSSGSHTITASYSNGMNFAAGLGSITITIAQ